jgi:hypothetical protein
MIMIMTKHNKEWHRSHPCSFAELGQNWRLISKTLLFFFLRKTGLYVESILAYDLFSGKSKTTNKKLWLLPTSMLWRRPELESNGKGRAVAVFEQCINR